LFCPAFLKAGARRAGESAFLLLTFLCAYAVKEKWLNGFAIKGLLTLFSL
jgi:hypothetical protein